MNNLTLKDKNTSELIGPFQINSLVCANVLDALPKIPDNSFDVAIADPPYNLSKGNNWKWDNSIKLPGFGGDWNKVMQEWDDMSLCKYFQFTVQWIRELQRIIKPSGSLWIHGTYHNIGIINFVLQLLEIEIINEVIWYKRNSFPNLSGRRLTASHETIIWAHTGKNRKYLFNYKEIKKAQFPEDALHKVGRQMRTVWDIPNNKEKREIRFGKHPTQKPLRLLRRMLMISSQANQKCLIPFAGAGSECISCLESDINFLAFEINPEFISIAKKRIEDSQNNLFLSSCPAIKIVMDHSDNNMDKVELLDGPLSASKNTSVPPLIKWTGSKRLQANKIKSYLPEYDRYFEPFLGGGALLFFNCGKETVASDIYEPLIKLWVMVRDNVECVIRKYREDWHKLQNSLPAYFYEIRNLYNKYHDPLDLLFLTRTCVNGIIRFNEKGEFNNSFHLSRKGMHPESFSKIARQWSTRIKNVRFECTDYKTIFNETKKGDFVYLDPPYAGNKQRYIADIDHEEFFNCLQVLNSKGVKYALSFDGFRGDIDFRKPMPKGLYMRKVLINSGYSPVKKVLSGQTSRVEESLYLNY